MHRVLSVGLVAATVVLAGCGGSDSPGAGSSPVTADVSTTTVPLAATVNTRVSEFVNAYLTNAFKQRPEVNGRATKDNFTSCVESMSQGTAQSIIGSRQLPDDAGKRAAAEAALLSEAMSAVQGSIEGLIAACSRG